MSAINLRTRLAGISRIAEQDGILMPEIRVGVRSGDTPPTKRQDPGLRETAEAMESAGFARTPRGLRFR